MGEEAAVITVPSEEKIIKKSDPLTDEEATPVRSDGKEKKDKLNVNASSFLPIFENPMAAFTPNPSNGDKSNKGSKKLSALSAHASDSYQLPAPFYPSSVNSAPEFYPPSQMANANSLPSATSTHVSPQTSGLYAGAPSFQPPPPPPPQLPPPYLVNSSGGPPPPPPPSMPTSLTLGAKTPHAMPPPSLPPSGIYPLPPTTAVARGSTSPGAGAYYAMQVPSYQTPPAMVSMIPSALNIPHHAPGTTPAAPHGGFSIGPSVAPPPPPSQQTLYSIPVSPKPEGGMVMMMPPPPPPQLLGEAKTPQGAPLHATLGKLPMGALSLSPNFVPPPPHPMMHHSGPQPGQVPSFAPPPPPPKMTRLPVFTTVLMAGLPGTGKSTVAEGVVKHLSKIHGDEGWFLFSGPKVASKEKKTPWESIKEILDSLSTQVDTLLAQQGSKRTVKGLVIDKNVKTLEELHYIHALLLAKGVPLCGVIGLEVGEHDEEEATLLQRLQGDPTSERERLKYHRVIHTTVVNILKKAEMYFPVDANRAVNVVESELVQLILQFANTATPPHASPTPGPSPLWASRVEKLFSPLSPPPNQESRYCTFVTNYAEYYRVVTRVMECVQFRPGEFPSVSGCRVERFPLALLTDAEKTNALQQRYGIRKIVAGHKFLLAHVDSELYLVPSSVRGVYKVPRACWMGHTLPQLGTFVVEGSLVRQNRQNREMFLVSEVHYWAEVQSASTDPKKPGQSRGKGEVAEEAPNKPPRNIALGASWKDRQQLLERALLAECQAFPPGVDLIVVHQITEPIRNGLKLLDSTEYVVDGLRFQPLTTLHISDRVYEWYHPSSISFYFRVGKLISATPIVTPKITSPQLSPHHSPKAVTPKHLDAGSTHADPLLTPPRSPGAENASHRFTYALELYNKNERRYEQFRGATVDVRLWNVIEGSIVMCSLKDDGSLQHWSVKKVCTDLTRPHFVQEVEEALKNSMVPRVRIVAWLTEMISTLKKETSRTQLLSQSNSRSSYLRADDTRGQGAAPFAAAGERRTPQFHSTQASLSEGSRITQPPHSEAQSSYLNAVSKSTAEKKSASSEMHSAAKGKGSESRSALSANGGNALEQLAHIVPQLQIVIDSTPASSSSLSNTLPPRNSVRHVDVTLDGKKDIEKHSKSKPKQNEEKKSEDAVQSSCPQCLKPKTVAELRHNPRLNKTFCYDCWYLRGHAYCCRCHQFSTGKRAPATAKREDFCCHKCVTPEEILLAQERKRERLKKVQSERKHGHGSTSEASEATDSSSKGVEDGKLKESSGKTSPNANPAVHSPTDSGNANTKNEGGYCLVQ